MGLKLTNNAASNLAAGISAAAVSLTLTPGQGALFPALAAGDFFPLTLVRISDGAREIVEVTARATDTLTVIRAQEGTTALAFIAGDRVELRLTAGAVQAIIAGGLNYVLQNGAEANLAAASTAFVLRNTDGSLTLLNLDAVTGNLAILGTISLAAATAAAHAVRADQVQNQSLNRFTTGGTSTAYTLTPVPACTVITGGPRFRAQFHLTAGTNPTLAVSGLTAKPLKYYTAAGVKAACTAANIIAGMWSDVEDDGTDYVVIDPAGVTAINQAGGTLDALSIVVSGRAVGTPSALTSAAGSIAINLASACNFSHTTSENTTLAAPSNPVAGQSGIITITQGATPRTLAYNAFWKFPAGTIPNLTATAGAVDAFAYYVDSAARATCNLIQDIK